MYYKGSNANSHWDFFLFMQFSYVQVYFSRAPKSIKTGNNYLYPCTYLTYLYSGKRLFRYCILQAPNNSKMHQPCTISKKGRGPETCIPAVIEGKDE